MIEPGDLERLENRVQAALVEDGSLDIAGYGEISCVLNLTSAGRRFVCKRLPPMDVESFLAYKDVAEAYILALELRGITVVQTTFPAVGVDPLSGYCVQPRQERLLVDALRDDPGQWIESLVALIVSATGSGLGLDGQVSNWAVDEGRLVYFDVTTPLLRDKNGAERLDLEIFMKPLPAAMRPAVRRFMLGEILSHYYEPRAVMVDAAANLIKEQLEHLISPFLAAANKTVDDPITEREVRRYYRRDAITWEALLGLRRIDRWWQRSVRRRTYPFLLPGEVRR